MKQTQKQKVLEYLETGKVLDPITAQKLGMGIRLGSIIHILRHELKLKNDGREIKSIEDDEVYPAGCKFEGTIKSKSKIGQYIMTFPKKELTLF